MAELYFIDWEAQYFFIESEFTGLSKSSPSILDNCCYLFLGSHTKMRKYKNKIYIIIIFGRNPKNNKSEKRMMEYRKMAKNWLRRFKNAKC
jgi:hypothetical protein